MYLLTLLEMPCLAASSGVLCAPMAISNRQNVIAKRMGAMQRRIAGVRQAARAPPTAAALVQQEPRQQHRQANVQHRQQQPLQAQQQQNQGQLAFRSSSNGELAWSAMLALWALAPAASAAEALPGGPPASSYYVSLGLFVVTLPGLWSLIKRSPKAKIRRRTYEVAGPAQV